MKIDVKIQASLLVGVILACSPSHDWIEPHWIELDRTTTVSIRRTPNLSPRRVIVKRGDLEKQHFVLAFSAPVHQVTVEGKRNWMATLSPVGTTWDDAKFRYYQKWAFTYPQIHPNRPLTFIVNWMNQKGEKGTKTLNL